MPVAAWALSAGMFSMFPFLALYIQNVLGYSPLQVGVRLLPLTLLSFFVAPAAARVMERIRRSSMWTAAIPSGRLRSTEAGTSATTGTAARIWSSPPV
jgi:hypothetical protein